MKHVRNLDRSQETFKYCSKTNSWFENELIEAHIFLIFTAKQCWYSTEGRSLLKLFRFGIFFLPQISLTIKKKKFFFMIDIMASIYFVTCYCKKSEKYWYFIEKLQIYDISLKLNVQIRRRFLLKGSLAKFQNVKMHRNVNEVNQRSTHVQPFFKIFAITNLFSTVLKYFSL